MENRNTFSLLLIILVAIGVFFGFLLYFPFYFPFRALINEPIVDRAPTLPQNQPSFPALKTPRGELEIPSSDADAEKIEQFLVKAAAMAEKGRAIAIGAGCNIQPAVLEIEEGETLTIKNEDIIPHTLVFDNTQLRIEQGKTLATDLDFIALQGTYGFGCEENQGNVVGFIRIVE